MNALHPVPTHTLSRFILAQQRLYPKSTGELSDLLSSIGLGIKIISSLIATSGFKGLTGVPGRPMFRVNHQST